MRKVAFKSQKTNTTNHLHSFLKVPLLMYKSVRFNPSLLTNALSQRVQPFTISITCSTIKSLICAPKYTEIMGVLMVECEFQKIEAWD